MASLEDFGKYSISCKNHIGDAGTVNQNLVDDLENEIKNFIWQHFPSNIFTIDQNWTAI